MKIALYLQDLRDKYKNEKVFYKAMDVVKKSDSDILVFPEYCYTPFSEMCSHFDIINMEEQDIVLDKCFELSEYINKPLIFSGIDRFGGTYSLYVNAYPLDDETEYKFYFKHTATDCSAFDFDDYRDGFGDYLFEPVIFQEKKIGMTICYDCNHSLFSKVYSKNGIDILINSTGGNVIYDKWHKFNKVRAIENSCYNLVTMGYTESNKKNSYVFGYSPTGKALPFKNLTKTSKECNEIGSIYVFDTKDDNGRYDKDLSLNQKPTINKIQHFFIEKGNVKKLLKQSKEITKNIFVYSVGNKGNIVFALVYRNDIYDPKCILKLLYNTALKNIENKHYIIINKHGDIDKTLFECKLSDVLKVRAMENYCAVILESENYNCCFQCGKNRTAQVVQDVNGVYGLDLTRTTGPEAIWKDKPGMMKKSWRENFEWLIDRI